MFNQQTDIRIKKMKKIPKSELLNVIVPLYDEEACIREFHQRLINVLDGCGYPFRVIYVDDGSTDATYEQLVALASLDGRITIIQLSRNFGHQAALAAGLENSDGQIVITMDGDGQHPPEMIPTLLKKYVEGYEIVQTRRQETAKSSTFKRLSSRFFYWLINKLGNTKIKPGSADFRLMTKKVVRAICAMPEYHRFLRGLIPWLGFKACYLDYEPEKRIGGRSKYTLAKMFNLAENAIFSFSLVPLRIGLLLGLLFFVLALLESIYVLSFWFTGNQARLTPGWSSTIFVILITGGALMVMISLVGIYVGQIHQEVKKRPLFIIRTVYPPHEIKN